MADELSEAQRERIAGRKFAEDVIASLLDEHPEYGAGFWRWMKREFLTAVEPPKPPMSDEECKRFGKAVWKYGEKYCGWQVDRIPLEYWEFLNDQNIPIQRYLASRRIQAEMADLDD